MKKLLCILSFLLIFSFLFSADEKKEKEPVTLESLAKEVEQLKKDVNALSSYKGSTMTFDFKGSYAKIVWGCQFNGGGILPTHGFADESEAKVKFNITKKDGLNETLGNGTVIQLDLQGVFAEASVDKGKTSKEKFLQNEKTALWLDIDGDGSVSTVYTGDTAATGATYNEILAIRKTDSERTNIPAVEVKIAKDGTFDATGYNHNKRDDWDKHDHTYKYTGVDTTKLIKKAMVSNIAGTGLYVNYKPGGALTGFYKIKITNLSTKAFDIAKSIKDAGGAEYQNRFFPWVGKKYKIYEKMEGVTWKETDEWDGGGANNPVSICFGWDSGKMISDTFKIKIDVGLASKNQWEYKPQVKKFGEDKYQFDKKMDSGWKEQGNARDDLYVGWGVEKREESHGGNFYGMLLNPEFDMSFGMLNLKPGIKFLVYGGQYQYHSKGAKIYTDANPLDEDGERVLTELNWSSVIALGINLPIAIKINKENKVTAGATFNLIYDLVPNPSEVSDTGTVNAADQKLLAEDHYKNLGLIGYTETEGQPKSPGWAIQGKIGGEFLGGKIKADIPVKYFNFAYWDGEQKNTDDKQKYFYLKKGTGYFDTDTDANAKNFNQGKKSRDTRTVPFAECLGIGFDLKIDTKDLIKNVNIKFSNSMEMMKDVGTQPLHEDVDGTDKNVEDRSDYIAVSDKIDASLTVKNLGPLASLGVNLGANIYVCNFKIDTISGGEVQTGFHDVTLAQLDLNAGICIGITKNLSLGLDYAVTPLIYGNEAGKGKNADDGGGLGGEDLVDTPMGNLYTLRYEGAHGEEIGDALLDPTNMTKGVLKIYSKITF